MSWKRGQTYFHGIAFKGVASVTDKRGCLHMVAPVLDGTIIRHVIRGSRSPYPVQSYEIVPESRAIGTPSISLSHIGTIEIGCPLEAGIGMWWASPDEFPDPSGPEPPPPYPDDNPKPVWMPRMVVACLSLHVQLQHYTDEQLNSFANKISRAGVDYVRVMMCWDDPEWQGHISTVSPFVWIDGKAHLDRWNLAFDDNLIRLRDILKPYHVRIMFDLYDNCDAEHSPWAKNTNGVNGIYDYSNTAFKYAVQWADRIIAILPPSEGHRIGIGNELQTPDDAPWVLGLILPLGEYLRVNKRVKAPISISGNYAPNLTPAAHHIHGVLSPDHSPYFGIRDCCLQIHGIGLEEQFTEIQPGSEDPLNPVKDQLSNVRCYAYSDDGFYYVRDPARRGRCTNTGTRCQANNAERVKTIAAFWTELQPRLDGTPARLDHIEFLPSEICEVESPDLIEPASLEIYNQITMELWGLDIRRK